MSFVDNALGNVKKIYETIEGKTVFTVEVQKLKLKAIKTDTELSKLYERLGALYCKELRKRDELPAELELLLNSVDEKRAQISEIKEQIAAFKGGVACGECGHLNSNEADCCSKCGAEL